MLQEYERNEITIAKRTAYDSGFQAGADAARRECAGIALNEKVDADRSKDESDYAYNRATEDVAEMILLRVGKPVKE